MPTPFVFADGSANVWSAIIAAGIGAAVAAAAQAGAAIYKRARADAAVNGAPAPAAPAPAETCHWADVTGDQRPVTAQECGARMAGLNETIREIRDAMVEVKAQLGDGVKLRMREIAEDESEKAMGRHEAAHHNGKRR